MTCTPHPDAPHGFDRDASHTEERYVCDCESWTPPDGYCSCFPDQRITAMTVLDVGAIAECPIDYLSVRDRAEKLYDAGWRKQ